MQPRTNNQKDRVDALLDGTRSAGEIAALIGCDSGYVRATVARNGWQDRLRRERGTAAVPVARDPSRAEDDRLLGWIADRVAGLPVAAIAKRDRVGASHVQTATSAVRDADLAEAGEPPLLVGLAYLWGRR